VDRLDVVGHGAAGTPAVVLGGGRTLTYGDLAELVGGVEKSLRHNDKALVVCAGDRDLPTLLGYLAGLRLGHTVAFLPDTPEVLAAYRPEFVVPGPGGGHGLAELGYAPGEEWAGVRVFRRRTSGSAGGIRADTALLLATSGSTGSPKAVRLTYSGLAGNSTAIIEALGITAGERAASTLPITHSFGLSVLNTHLLAGASILLSDRTPLSLALWDELARAGVTSFAAVPTTYAAFGPKHVTLLGRTKIRTMTQSGARLADELTMRLSTMMASRQGRFFVMYGQTEATARMACLDPMDLPARLGSVGVAVPGAALSIGTAPAHHRAREGEGEVHYRGPGVMLGYATRREDLGRGAEVGALPTGDLGYLRDGYLYLTGRTKRIVKVLGLRTSLDDLERLVERPGQPAAVVAGTDDVVYLVGAGDPGVHEAQRRQLAESLGVPSRAVIFRPVPRLPQTASGKIDYRRLASVAAETP
jgi:acyl-CoA synthetase (AMP-forming)/AMP-acid ligase II